MHAYTIYAVAAKCSCSNALQARRLGRTRHAVLGLNLLETVILVDVSEVLATEPKWHDGHVGAAKYILYTCSLAAQSKSLAIQNMRHTYYSALP